MECSIPHCKFRVTYTFCYHPEKTLLIQYDSITNVQCIEIPLDHNRIFCDMVHNLELA